MTFFRPYHYTSWLHYSYNNIIPVTGSQCGPRPSSSSDSLILLRTSAFAPFFCHREFPHVCSEELAAVLVSLIPPPVASVNISFYPRFGWPATTLSLRRHFFGRSEPVVPETKETFCIQITEIHHFPAFDSLIVSAPWWAHDMLKIQSVHLIETN